jgi:hypothetical protein
MEAHQPRGIGERCENIVRRFRENKYALQLCLKDLDFDIEEEELTRRGFSLPFPSIAQAEQALTFRLIWPRQFWEYDGTVHQVLVFHPQPVGYSGFMNCVTHSLSLTDLGLFEVGRYPAVSLERPGHYWRWFLHRRLAMPGQVAEWQKQESITE